MTTYIKGPSKGKADMIRQAGGSFLGGTPARLAPGPGVYICVVDNGAFEAAAVVDTEKDLHEFRRKTDTRPKVWLYVDADTLANLI